MAWRGSGVQFPPGPPMKYAPEFLTVAIAHLLAVMSPGPDFVLMTRNSLVYSRRSGIFSALGIACGILVHVTYSIMGIGFLISRSILLFSIVKYLGAAYLIYIGIKSLRAQPHIDTEGAIDRADDLNASQAFRMGFLTNALNPKVTLFFFALFTQVIGAGTPITIKALYGIEMAIMTFVWFALVAIVLSQHRVKKVFARTQHWAERIFGVVIIAFGIRVAAESAK